MLGPGGGGALLALLPWVVVLVLKETLLRGLAACTQNSSHKFWNRNFATPSKRGDDMLGGWTAFPCISNQLIMSNVTLVIFPISEGDFHGGMRCKDGQFPIPPSLHWPFNVQQVQLVASLPLKMVGLGKTILFLNWDGGFPMK